MKKFVLLHYGFETPTQEIMDAWGKWFMSLGDKMTDQGSHFSHGREVSHTGIKELPLAKDSITGYTFIKAENLDEATNLAKTCPSIQSIRVYEAGEM